MISNITGRHMEVTEAIRNYVDKKVTRLRKYHDRISELDVILDEEGQGHKIELIAKVEHHDPFVVTEHGQDMYACLDAAVDKLERQLTRFKEMSRNRKGRTGAAEATAEALEAGEETP